MPRYTSNPLLPQIESILKANGAPMHYMEITGLLIQSDAWTVMPKSPEKSVTHILSAEIKANGETASVKRTAPGVYALTGESVFEVNVPERETGRSRIKKFFGWL